MYTAIKAIIPWPNRIRRNDTQLPYVTSLVSRLYYVLLNFLRHTRFTNQTIPIHELLGPSRKKNRPYVYTRDVPPDFDPIGSRIAR